MEDRAGDPEHRCPLSSKRAAGTRSGVTAVAASAAAAAGGIVTGAYMTGFWKDPRK